jgi:uncharacterized protein (DUF1778 family)
MAGKPKDPDRVKTHTLRIRMSDADRELLEQAAVIKSLETSTWARTELVALARKILAKNTRPDGSAS